MCVCLRVCACVWGKVCVCAWGRKRDRVGERERITAQTGVSKTGKATPSFFLKGIHDGVCLTNQQLTKQKGFTLFFFWTDLIEIQPWQRPGPEEEPRKDANKHSEGWSGSAGHESASVLHACLSFRILLPGPLCWNCPNLCAVDSNCWGEWHLCWTHTLCVSVSSRSWVRMLLRLYRMSVSLSSVLY